MKKYKDFDSWFQEPEGYGLRAERFYDSLDQISNKQALDDSMRLWLEAAFNAARVKQRGCKFPDCLCIGDSCSYTLKVIRNPI